MGSGQTFSKRQLLLLLWGPQYFVFVSHISYHTRREEGTLENWENSRCCENAMWDVDVLPYEVIVNTMYFEVTDFFEVKPFEEWKEVVE